MSTEKLEKDNLPFTVTEQEGSLIFEAVAPDNLSKKAKREFNDNKAVVEVQLFDSEYLDRVNAMPRSDEFEEKGVSIVRSTFGLLFNALTVR